MVGVAFIQIPREPSAFRSGEESGCPLLGGNKFLCIVPSVLSLNNATVLISDALNHASPVR